MNVNRTASVATLAAMAALLTACSYSSEPATPVHTETTVTETDSVTVPPSTPATTTAAVTSPPTSAPATTSASAVTVKHNTCLADKLTVRILPGGAIRGHEIAAVSVTNADSTPCVVWGFPKVHLELAGAPLGSPSTEKGSPTEVRLAPGAQAQALISDASTCNAPLSDTISATLPELSKSVSRPMQMRGCSLEVAPFKPAE